MVAKNGIIKPMNRRHRKTLAAMFAKPQSGTIDWADIEALLLAVGAELIEGRQGHNRLMTNLTWWQKMVSLNR
jgi:hypothetical protein